MIDLTTPIIPYEGIGTFNLNENYQAVIEKLKSMDIRYTEEVSKPNDTDPAWYIIGIAKEGSNFDSIELFFANDRLFKIVLEEDFKGSLPNGINLDTNIEDALKIDSALTFNDWDEIYESEKGYWIEDNLKTKKLLSITIFIPALERDDFFDYNW